MSILIDQANGVFGTDWIDQMFDKLSPEKLRQTLIYLREAVSGVFSGDGIGGMVEELGRKFGEGIVRGSLNMDPKGTSGGIMKGLLQGLLPQAKNDNGLSTLISQGAEQTGYLRRIADKKGGWV